MKGKFKSRLKELKSKDAITTLWQGAVGSAVYVMLPSLLNKVTGKDTFNGYVGLGAALAGTGLVSIITGWKPVWYAGLIHTGGQFIWSLNEKIVGQTFDAFPASLGGINDYMQLPSAEPSFNYLPAMSDYVVEPTGSIASLNDFAEEFNQAYNS